MLQDVKFKTLLRFAFPEASPSSSSSSAAASYAPDSHEPSHQNLLLHALYFIVERLENCALVVRDTHSAKSTQDPQHKMDACLVWNGSVSSIAKSRVAWQDVVCPIEIKPEINLDCVRQLSDTSSEIFVLQWPREYLYGIGMSAHAVQVFQFSCPIQGEPALSWTQPTKLFSSDLDPNQPTIGFQMLVGLCSQQQLNGLGFHSFGADSQFCSFLQEHDHFRNSVSVKTLQLERRLPRKPVLLSLKPKSAAVAAASSSSSVSTSSTKSVSLQQKISSDLVPLENLALDSVRCCEISLIFLVDFAGMPSVPK